jgi:hypothetical protein
VLRAGDSLLPTHRAQARSNRLRFASAAARGGEEEGGIVNYILKNTR